MAKDSVYNALQKPVADHGRNVFSLDNKQVYSMKAGQITPVKCIHFMPNDYFDIQAHDFSLTFPMNTAAFLRGRKEFAFYSVYYNAVWSLFNQYQAGRLEPKTSAFPVEPIMQEPRIKIIDMLLGCVEQFARLMWYEWKLKGNSISSRSWLNSSSYYQPWKIAAGVDIMDSSYWTGYASSVKSMFTRVAYSWPFIADPSTVRVKDIVFDVVGQWRAYNWLRKLDMLGYGNYYPFFRSVESKILALDASDPTTIGSFVNNIINLGLDLIDTCTQYEGDFTNGFTIVAEKKYNLYPICAYNAVFYHFFRNSFYDLKYYSHNYNLDFVSLAVPPGGAGHGNYNELSLGDFDIRFLDIEYHQWKKDRFTGVLPDQQFGAVSGISLNFVGSTSPDLGRWSTPPNSGQLGDRAEVVTAQSGGNLAQLVNGSPIYINHSHAYSVTQGFDVVALKRAEMLQDYRQQLMRAGNKTTDIFKALYGKECSSEHVDDIIPRFLETFGEDIFVDPVTSTADTGADSSRPNGNLGDLSARAKLSGSSGRIQFNAGGNFGVILCLAYVVPIAEYNSYMVDKHLMELTPEAHFIPQFENLGLEDIYNFELNCLLPYNNAQALGKAPRYYHKKGDVDQVHGAFVSLPYEYIGGQSQSYQILSLEYGGFTGDFNHWVSPRSELQGRLSTTVRDFYVNPSVLDNVFVRAAGYDLADDQFICNTYFEIRSTKEMSKVGFVNFV